MAPWALDRLGRSDPQKRNFNGYDCLFALTHGRGSLPFCPSTRMLIERHADAVVVWAPAKVNLYLEVLAKRLDGYHDIATLMVAVDLYDILEFKEEISGEIRLECQQPELTTGPENLVVRAAQLLRRRS